MGNKRQMIRKPKKVVSPALVKQGASHGIDVEKAARAFEGLHKNKGIQKANRRGN